MWQRFRDVEWTLEQHRRTLQRIEARLDDLDNRFETSQTKFQADLENIFENCTPMTVWVAQLHSEQQSRQELLVQLLQNKHDIELLREQLLADHVHLHRLLSLPVTVTLLREEVGDLARTVFTEPAVSHVRPSSAIKFRS